MLGTRGRLALVHANDSKDPCGSRRDRHENIGAGQIGERRSPSCCATRQPAGVPFVIETPGPKAAHAADIATLTRLRARLTASARSIVVVPAQQPCDRAERLKAALMVSGYSWYENRSSCQGSAELW